MDGAEIFDSLIVELQNEPTVTKSRMSGSMALKVKGKVFAMLVRGNMVVKLPSERVGALIKSKEGGFFDPGHGRIMKEWVSIKPTSKSEWSKLAKEAKEFVERGKTS